MTDETLTAEERESLVTCYDPDESVIKLLRLYDAALARAEAAERDKLHWMSLAAIRMAAESRLAEARELLDEASEAVDVCEPEGKRDVWMARYDQFKAAIEAMHEQVEAP